MNLRFSFNAITVAFATTLLLSACGESTSSDSGDGFNSSQPPVDTSFNEQALIENLVDNVITPTYQSFSEQAELQHQAVIAFCQAEQSLADMNGSEQAVNDAKQGAKTQWKAAMDIWQQAELMQLGPLLENDSLLRNNIYSWPVVNSCAVDFDVVFHQQDEVNGAPYDITKRTPSRKGMAALEYLLFTDTLSDSCPTGSPDGWNNQTETAQRLARCGFATEVALDISNRANELVNAWLGSDGVSGYATILKNAGTADSQFDSEHQAVNRLSDALFYLDSTTKDGKLATPLGLFANSCGAQACAQEVESGFANYSIEHITNNLIGFQRMLTGENGVGFIEYLLDVGDQETADAMTASVESSLEDTQAYQQSLAQALVNNQDQVTQTHQQVKAVTDKLKVDFINSLALELPQTAAGDND